MERGLLFVGLIAWRARAWVIAAVVTVCAAAVVGVLPILAQAPDGAPPPLPYIFEGSVTLDGDPVPTGQLTLRIGDWESKPVPVVDGVFTCSDPCLIAGPPNRSYIGQELSFHLNGVHKARLTFPFQEGPARVRVELVFGERAATPTPVPQAADETPLFDPTPVPVAESPSGDGLPWWLLPAGGGAALAFVMGGYAAVRRYSRTRDGVGRGRS